MSAQEDDKLYRALRQEINAQIDQIAHLQKVVRDQEHEIVRLKQRLKQSESSK